MQHWERHGQSDAVLWDSSSSHVPGLCRKAPLVLQYLREFSAPYHVNTTWVGHSMRLSWGQTAGLFCLRCSYLLSYAGEWNVYGALETDDAEVSIVYCIETTGPLSRWLLATPS